MDEIWEKTINQTEWEKLGISNDFLFGKVMQDAELCKELLQIIFPNMKIDHIEYPVLQKTINMDADAKSIRLDVYIVDNKGTVYDIEMQMADTKELPKRTRYYQAMMDLEMIDKGQSYKKLKKSFVIFICPFDLFNEGRHLYTFKNICIEGKMADVNQKLIAFLDYVAGKKSDDSFVQKLENAIKIAKQNREWRHEYMTLLMRDQENIEKGIERGIEKEETRIIIRLYHNGFTPNQIADLVDKDIKKVEAVVKRELNVDAL